MGSNERGENGGYNKSRWRMTKPCLFIILVSLLLSMAGGSLLGWWLHKYHQTNSQLWMVPFGFLLFLTPLIISLSLILPVATDQQQPFKTPQRDHVSLSQPNTCSSSSHLDPTV
ncbi:hypothetical protein Fmac_007227 [Flemingia macrophylla]|uniref:Transmembrane protein n=1 Tax=Flemingia macrophylla TaxID=520843 RepID=A0ABD1NCU9_9FABA